MPQGPSLQQRLKKPAVRRAAAIILAIGLAHIALFAWIVPAARMGGSNGVQRIVAPIYLDITPRARPARTPQPVTTASGPAGSPLPPIAVRPASSSAAPSQVAPFVVDTPPPQVQPQQPGRVLPRSWRERCGLGDGPVSDAEWTACRDVFMQAAGPGDHRAPGPRGDPTQQYAAAGAARMAAYEAREAPTPVGGGLARPSDTPGSNFGWGEMDASVQYATGSRPQTMGRED